MIDYNYIVLIFYVLSNLLVGSICFYFFKTHVEHLQNTIQNDIQLRYQKDTLPIRIQAFERLTLLVERIKIGSLVNRVKPMSKDKNHYEELLIKTIEQEFEHNLVQQIYVSQECWDVIKTSRNATITKIRKTNIGDNITDAYKLREVLVTDMLDQHTSPHDIAIQMIKRDLQKIL